jgi:pimeloyl-ACP methyl ester carboxylesterase
VLKKLLQKILPKAIGAQINVTALWSKKSAAKKAFLIFCMPRKGRSTPEQLAYLNSATQEEIAIDKKVSVQTYHWKGKGKTVLLVHGWESNAHRWWKLIDVLLQRDYNIIAFDAPGHGSSKGRLLNVPLYTKCLEHITQRFKPEIHIGHSIGGLTNIYHFHTYAPAHLKKMVVLGAPSELSEIMSDYQKILGMTDRVMRALDLHIQEQFGFPIASFSGAAFAKAITIPGLIIHDKHDTIAPVTASRTFHKNWPKSNYIETEGLGHSLYQDEVRTAIIDFID